MSSRNLSFDCRYSYPIVLLVLAFGVLTRCGSKSQSTTSAPAQRAASTTASSTLDTLDADAAQQKTALVLPKHFGRFTGDWDGMVKNGQLRVLVVYSKGHFFYDKGRARGAICVFRAWTCARCWIACWREIFGCP